MARILFIGIDYYAYVEPIRSAFLQLGYEADYRPIEDVSLASKTFKKLAPRAYRRRLDAYHRRIIEESAATHYDLVFFLQVHHLSDANIKLLKQYQPQARFILYNWDSLATHDYRPWLPYFDRAFTFDPEDAETIGIGYLPLFALPLFYKVDRTRPKDFDLYFVGAIGTMHRFDALARLHKFCAEHGVRLKLHLKCSPAIRLQLLRTGRRLPGLTLKSLNFSQIIDLMERSRGVFDFANHRQTGYTMRFIENMCAGQKIVTENRRVVTEDFFRDDRFHVINDLDFSSIPAFLDWPIESELDVARFSVDNWVRVLVEG